MYKMVVVYWVTFYLLRVNPTRLYVSVLCNLCNQERDFIILFFVKTVVRKTDVNLSYVPQ